MPSQAQSAVHCTHPVPQHCECLTDMRRLSQRPGAEAARGLELTAT